MPVLQSAAAEIAERGSPSDAALLEEYRLSGSQEAFAQLVDRHGWMVLQVGRRILGNAADAEDVAQGVFWQLAQRPQTVERSVAGWLRETAKNRAINELRGRRRRLQREEHAAARRVAGTDAELREEVGLALRQLRTRLRQAVVLRYVEGRSLMEAAQAAGCPPGTLARRSHEGLRQLRGILSRRLAPTLAALLAALSAHTKLSFAAVLLVATGVGLSVPLMQSQSEPVAIVNPGWPTEGTVTIQGVTAPFRCIPARDGDLVYYQVLVPTQSGKTRPFTVGVPPRTRPDRVQRYIESRLSFMLSGAGVPLAD